MGKSSLPVSQFSADAENCLKKEIPGMKWIFTPVDNYVLLSQIFSCTKQPVTSSLPKL